MNVAAMCSYISYLVDDLEFSYFTKVQLYRFINQAVGETQKKLIDSGQNWYLKITPDSGAGSIPTVANQSAYTYPTDLMETNRIELVTNPGVNETRITLSSITLNQKDMFTSQPAQTVAYYMGKDNYNLVPTPNVGGDILRVYYNYRVTEITGDSDTVDVPVEYHEYVCNLAAIQCFIKDDRDLSSLLTFTQSVESNLQRKALERSKDRASSVVITSDDCGWY